MRTLSRYVIAIGAVLLAWLLRELLSPVLGPNSLPFLFFFPAIVLAAWHGRLRLALVSIGLSTILATFFIEGRVLSNSSTAEAVGLLTFLIAALVIALAIESMHRANARAIRTSEERRRADESAAHLAAVVTSSSDAIISKTVNGIVTSWNDAAQAMFGYTAAEMIGNSILLLIPAELRGEEDFILSRIRAGERVEHYETVRVRKDGTRVDVSLMISPIKSSDGTVIGASKIARDVTDRKRTERSLHESMRQQKALYAFVDRLHRSTSLEDVYEAALDSIIHAMACDRASILLFDDAGAMRIVGARGLSAEYQAAVEGHSPWDRDAVDPQPIPIPDIETSDLEPSLKDVVRKEGIRALHFIPLVSGTELIGKFMTYYNGPHVFSREELDLAVGLARQLAFGISRLRTEMALRHSEHELADFFESASLGLHWVDANGIIVRANRAELEMLGYTSDEYVGRHIAEFHVDHDVIADILDRLLRGDLINDYPARLKSKDGSIRDVIINSSGYWENGEFIHTRCFTRDVTDYKRAEAALRENEERLRLATDAGSVGVWDWDIPLGRVSWTDSLYAMHGVTREMFDGSLNSFQSLIYPDDRELVLKAIDESFTKDVPYELEFRILKPSGEVSWIFTNAVVFRDGEKPVRMLGATVDITERKLAESERERLLIREQELRVAAEESNRLKDEFLATMSHELRNPLNVILGYSELLLRTEAIKTSPQLLKMGEALRRNALSQSHLIRDLLDLSRLRSGKLTLNAETVSLMTALNNAVETVRSEAAAKNLNLTIEAPDEALFVKGDLLRLEQIIWNLLTNSVKFTPPGGSILVSATKDGTDVALTVTDTGQGIEAEFLPHVFEMFRQADASTSRAQSGMGIGLALVRQLIELHGGIVSVQSAGQDLGTTVTVRLPLTAELHETVSPVLDLTAQKLSKLGVLVLDDSEDTIEMLRHLLEQGGARVTTATSAVEALQLASENEYDVVLSDISMPGMDGFEFVRRLRELPGKKDVPVLALTGFGRPEDIDRAQSEGFFTHLTKPFDLAKLSEILERLPPRRRSGMSH
jgi:PAS domain S-box-containing protein